MTAEPTEVLRVCMGCGVPTPSTRCPDCTSEVNQRRGRGGASARGYGRRWERTAAGVKRRQPFCSVCGTTERLSVDHIVAKANGGTDDPTNLQTLCVTHNSAKGKR